MNFVKGHISRSKKEENVLMENFLVENSTLKQNYKNKQYISNKYTMYIHI